MQCQSNRFNTKMIFFKFLFSEDSILILFFQKTIVAQYFTTLLKISKAINCFMLSFSVLRGGPNHEARERQSCPGSEFQELTPAGFLQNFGYKSGSGLLIFLLKQNQDRD